MKKMSYLLGMVAIVLVTSCGKSQKEVEIEKQKALVAYRDSVKLDSFKRAAVAEEKRKVEEQNAKIEAQRAAELAAAKRVANRSYSSGGTVTTSSAGVTRTAAKKKGWSDAAKGTAIGAGVGAVTGILVDKNNVRGGVIGGLAGAGAGYAIGRGEDRKSGRVQKN